MAGLKPYASFTVDGKTAEVSPIRAIRVNRRLSGGSDELRFALTLNSGFDLTVDSEIAVEMGWGDSGQSVFSGDINSLQYCLHEVHGIAHGSQKKLTQLRINETYIDQSAGDVVNDILTKAGVTAGVVDTGIQLPKYLADDGLTLFEHLQQLARLCGVDVFTDADEKLNFTKRETFTADHIFEFGINLIDARISLQKANVTAIEIIPESPASQEGAAASSWFIKSSNEVSATSGDGNLRRFSNAICTTKEAAETASNAYQRDIQRRATNGKIMVMGLAEANPGQVVELKNMPDASTNGLYQINGIDHTMDGINGFRSTLYLWGEA